MRTFEAVTTFSAEGYEQYGKAMVRSFAANWPSEIPLHVYADWHLGFGRVAPEWQREFFRKWMVKPRARGMNGQKYNFRNDAVKFSHKVGAIIDAYERCESDVLIWVDADTVTHSRVTLDFLEGLFPEGKQIAWLDREMLYPECGFVMYRAKDAGIVALFDEWRGLYESGKLFDLQEWHDSWVFEQLVKKHGLKAQSLSGPEGRKTHHPFVNSVLGECMDHCKGNRKIAGRSRPTDIKVQRTESYWQ